MYRSQQQVAPRGHLVQYVKNRANKVHSVYFFDPAVVLFRMCLKEITAHL